MKLLWTSRGWSHYRHWQDNDPVIVKRINALIDDAFREPYRGIGKPEALRENLSGWWSRRITQEHRLVYRCIGQGDDRRIEVAQCRFHY